MRHDYGNAVLKPIHTVFLAQETFSRHQIFTVMQSVVSITENTQITSSVYRRLNRILVMILLLKANILKRNTSYITRTVYNFPSYFYVCYPRVGTCMKINVFCAVFIQRPDRCCQPNAHECTSHSNHE